MKTVPTVTTDAEAEAFLDQDLSDLDVSQFKPHTWETSPAQPSACAPGVRR